MQILIFAEWRLPTVATLLAINSSMMGKQICTADDRFSDMKCQHLYFRFSGVLDESYLICSN